MYNLSAVIKLESGILPLVIGTVLPWLFKKRFGEMTHTVNGTNQTFSDKEFFGMGSSFMKIITGGLNVVCIIYHLAELGGGESMNKRIAIVDEYATMIVNLSKIAAGVGNLDLEPETRTGLKIAQVAMVGINGFMQLGEVIAMAVHVGTQNDDFHGSY